MRLKLFSALALVLAPLAAAFCRWPAGAAFMALALFLARWPAILAALPRKKRSPRHAV